MDVGRLDELEEDGAAVTVRRNNPSVCFSAKVMTCCTSSVLRMFAVSPSSSLYVHLLSLPSLLSSSPSLSFTILQSTLNCHPFLCVTLKVVIAMCQHDVTLFNQMTRFCVSLWIQVISGHAGLLILGVHCLHTF